MESITPRRSQREDRLWAGIRWLEKWSHFSLSLVSQRASERESIAKSEIGTIQWLYFFETPKESDHYSRSFTLQLFSTWNTSEIDDSVVGKNVTTFQNHKSDTNCSVCNQQLGISRIVSRDCEQLNLSLGRYFRRNTVGNCERMFP